MLNTGYIITSAYVQNFQFHMDLHISPETNTANPTIFERMLLNFKD